MITPFQHFYEPRRITFTTNAKRRHGRRYDRPSSLVTAPITQEGLLSARRPTHIRATPGTPRAAGGWLRRVYYPCGVLLTFGRHLVPHQRQGVPKEGLLSTWRPTHIRATPGTPRAAGGGRWRRQSRPRRGRSPGRTRARSA